MPTNGFGSDFFDRVLGIAGDSLGGFIQNLPSYPSATVMPSTERVDYSLQSPTFDFSGFTDLSGTDFGGGLFANPFQDTLQQSINYARQNSGLAQSLRAHQEGGQAQQQQPAGAQAVTRWGRMQQQHAQQQTAQAQMGGSATLIVPPTGELPDYARSVAKAYGVDPEIFVRQITQESGFRADAVSPAGARGIAQFMPGTAQMYGVNVDDPYSSLDGAARHMRDLLKRYNGNYRLALAAYNAGPGNVDKYGEGVFSADFANGETLRYVTNILGN